MKILSIIVPVYNTSKYLVDCLESLLHQGFKEHEYEIICIDDGSLDDSREIIEKYANQYTNIKPIFKVNGGVSSARNIGIEHATGKYIAFVDSDDFVCTGAFKILCDKLCNDSLDMAIFSYSTVDENSSYTFTQTGTEMTFYKINSNIAQAKATVWSSIVKSSVIHHNRIRFPENLKYGEDSFFSGVVSMFIESDKQICTDFKVYSYRIRSDSAMHSSDKQRLLRHMNDKLETIDAWKNFLDCHPDLNKKQYKNVLDRIFLCSAAAILDSLRISDIDPFAVRDKLRFKGCYPYPYMIYILKRGFTVSNILMFFLRCKIVFWLLAKTRILNDSCFRKQI